MDMKQFAASTDVMGNRTKTGDDSMANVVGGTSMADSAPAMTSYDVSMEAGAVPPMAREVGGREDVFSTYILPSYEMPSAGASGHGVHNGMLKATKAVSSETSLQVQKDMGVS